jgi:hypothetical protein
MGDAQLLVDPSASSSPFFPCIVHSPSRLMFGPPALCHPAIAGIASLSAPGAPLRIVCRVKCRLPQFSLDRLVSGPSMPSAPSIIMRTDFW